MSLVALLGILLPDANATQDEVMVVVSSAVMTLGLSLICLVIPVGIGFWTWRSYKKEQASIEQTVIPEEDF